MPTSMTPPKVFGVEMRQRANPIYWELEGVEMICPAGEQWYYWQVQFGGSIASGSAWPLELAEQRIRESITRIRAAVDKLGK